MPARPKPPRENPIIDIWSRKELLDVYLRGDPVCINVEINQRCAGGCKYCYVSPVGAGQAERSLPVEKFEEILRLKKAGVRVVYLYGGDQLLHPGFEAMVSRAIDEGIHVVMPLSGRIPRSDAAWLAAAHARARSAGVELFAGIHVDTLDQAVHDRVNASPVALKERLDGFQALLDAGFPADHVFGCPTLTRQTAGTMIPLMDWFYGKGVKHVAPVVFKPLGLSRGDAATWEPALSQVKRVFYHRARVEGKHVLAVGSCDGKYACQGHVAITASGDVVPCLFLRDFPAGNIYEEDVGKIIKRSKKDLLLKRAVKGPCAACRFKVYCIGCRANAYLYAGDINASDPKCFFNKDAPERCSSKKPGESVD